MVRSPGLRDVRADSGRPDSPVSRFRLMAGLDSVGLTPLAGWHPRKTLFCREIHEGLPCRMVKGSHRLFSLAKMLRTLDNAPAPRRLPGSSETLFGGLASPRAAPGNKQLFYALPHRLAGAKSDPVGLCCLMSRRRLPGRMPGGRRVWERKAVHRLSFGERTDSAPDPASGGAGERT